MAVCLVQDLVKVKLKILPDAHSDFIFAVAGEEFGVFIALAVIGLFGFLVLRGCLRIMSESSLFVFLAVAGYLHNLVCRR